MLIITDKNYDLKVEVMLLSTLYKNFKILIILNVVKLNFLYEVKAVINRILQMDVIKHFTLISVTLSLRHTLKRHIKYFFNVNPFRYENRLKKLIKLYNILFTGEITYNILYPNNLQARLKFFSFFSLADYII